MEKNNNKNKNTEYEDVFQGVATLGNERPKKAKPGSLGKEPDKAQPQADKSRNKFSGAARVRRRYRKQKQMEGRSDAEKPATEPNSASAAMQETRERESAGSCKRLRSEQSTASLSSTAQLGKRPKIAVDQRTFAQTTSGLVRVAMVPIEYPERRLDDKEAALLKEKVRGSILGIAKSTKASTFKDTSDRDGAVIFNCTNTKTEGWLRSLTSVIDLNRVRLRALRLDELPRRHRVVVHVEDPIPVKEAIELLRQNDEGLQAADWVVARGNKSRDAASTHFAALNGEGALRALKALNFKLFCGLGQVAVKLPGGNRGEALSKKKDETGTV